MEGVRTFLESSTIHGLTYISTTQKYARFFWFLVVVAGFVAASLLIKESFDSWLESPIKTTIETLPISDIKFPKLTVCPPRDTFTDLNYDLMLTEKLTLTDEMRDEMFKYALEVLVKSNWSKLHEEDRFYNWYYGYTDIESPTYKSFNGLNFEIHTSATSGEVTTQHYGKQFMPELVERKLRYRVFVYPPDSVKYNDNLTLHFKLDKLSMTGLVRGRNERFLVKRQPVGSDLTSLYRNISMDPYESKTIELVRDVSTGEVEAQKLDVMPGFRFTWWYSGAEVIPDNKYKYSKNTRYFVR